jgi:hypothetical protein
VSQHTARVRHAHSAEHDKISGTETVHIEA